MLVLSRKTNEKILIGDDIEVVIVGVSGDNVRIGIKAPKDIKILRSEIYEEIEKQNVEAAAVLKLQDEEVSIKLKQLLTSQIHKK